MPTTRVRPDPIIPDHEVLRRIGGGAYGEVWLARGVTGALRAVKVLWREDFEDERSFEREFDGILKYEPISRDHPGLVDVLHVGRSDGEQAFYFYVMELGDDVLSGNEINPIEYEARTLRSDVKRAGGKPLDPDFCIEVGQRLAEALDHLHERGLAHRDVKPANVIFVDGQAKLADIGLVAARGQRTFVGTEGFVPPEGPGTAKADVYSLGKVLYEVATGKDRLEFPELPEEVPPEFDRKKWLAVNQVICEVCDPQVSRRTIRSGRQLAEALKILQLGKRRRRPKPFAAMTTALLLGAAMAWGGWTMVRSLLPASPPPTEPTELAATAPRQAFVKVTSTPDGADVVELVGEDSGVGELMGRTPTEVLESYVGEEISLRILREGYRPYEITIEVPPSAAEEPLVVSAALQVFSPPTVHEPWSDHLEEDYRPIGEAHESVYPVGEKSWQAYLKSSKRPANVGQLVPMATLGEDRKVVATSPSEAEKFCAWLTRVGIEEGYLTADHEALPRYVEGLDPKHLNRRGREAGWGPFHVMVRTIPYARLVVATEPVGAEIYVDGISRGYADEALLIEGIQPGPVQVLASLEGFKSESRRVELQPSQTLPLQFKLRPNMSVVMDKPWENSLGMKLLPLGEDLMVSAWETRRSDYRVFATAEDRRMPPPTDWSIDTKPEEDDRHPVVYISRDDADAFCRWLTQKELAEDRLNRSLEYRLPTDAEWTQMTGREALVGLSPAKRDQIKPKRFFWGWNWPPPDGVGNLGSFPGFDDGFASTAPVGNFPPNEAGFYDLCGNAQEWVSDSYSRLDEQNGLLRGGGWQSYQEKDLYIGSRNPQPPDAADSSYGFRVVLAKRPAVEGNWSASREALDDDRYGSGMD
jgi:serine/threonine protein kinase